MYCIEIDSPFSFRSVHDQRLLPILFFSLQLSGVGPGPGTNQPPVVTTGSSGLSGWIYAVIAIAVVGIILILLLIGVIVAVRRRDKPRR